MSDLNVQERVLEVLLLLLKSFSSQAARAFLFHNDAPPLS